MQSDLDPGPGDPGVGGEEVLRQQEPELLRTGDAALLGQDVHRVLLAVRGDDVRVVSRLIILTIIIIYISTMDENVSIVTLVLSRVSSVTTSSSLMVCSSPFLDTCMILTPV